MRPSTDALLTALFAAALIGCPTEPIDDVLIGDDDDAGTDDDDSAGDDDDSGGADDDDATPPSFTVTVRADLPPDSVLAMQDGDGPFSVLPLKGMSASFDISDPDGRYGLVLACAGPARAGVQVHLSDAESEPNPVMGCAEAAIRGLDDGALTGPVLNTENDMWSLYVGSRRWLVVPGTLTSYQTYMPLDNYDLIAVRRDPSGLANKMLIQRVLPADADPNVPIDFNDDGSGVPHTPELATLLVTTTAPTTSTTGVFLSRGGSIWPLGSAAGGDAVFRVFSNERRFSTDMFLFRTDSAHDAECVGQTLTLLTSSRMEDFNTAARHGAPEVPIAPQSDAVCEDFTGLNPVATAADLTLDWSAGLASDHTLAALSTTLTSPSGATRWTVTAHADRAAHGLNLADLGPLLGAAYPLPTTGWTWIGTGWELPVDGVTGSQIALATTSDMFTSIPQGRSRFQFDPDAQGSEERDHEYEEDDETRGFVMLPWDETEYSAHGVQRSGILP